MNKELISHLLIGGIVGYCISGIILHGRIKKLKRQSESHITSGIFLSKSSLIYIEALQDVLSDLLMFSIKHTTKEIDDEISEIINKINSRFGESTKLAKEYGLLDENGNEIPRG